MKKSKKITAVLCIAVLTLSMGTALLADDLIPGVQATMERRGRGPANIAGMAALTAEERAERQAEMQAQRGERQVQREALQENWAALSDAQKAEVYSLIEEKVELNKQIIDKYVALGLITAEEATEMKSNLTEAHSQMLSQDRMPNAGGMMGRSRMGGRNPGRFCQVDNTATGV